MVESRRLDLPRRHPALTGQHAMALATTCPHCGTRFHVTPEQLKQRDGLVRCGQCRQTFSGIATLAEFEAQMPQAAPACATPEPSPPLPASVSPASVSPASTTPGRSEPDFRIPAPESVTTPAPALVAAPVARDPARRESRANKSPPARRRTTRILAWVLILVLTLGLALELALSTRDWLITRVPASAPALRWLGAQVGVTVLPPATLEALGAHAFALEPAERTGEFTLHGVLRNAAAHPVRWPALDVKLTDAGGTPLLRRTVQPAEYLTGLDPTLGLRAGGEFEVRLTLTVNAEGPAPAGFSVVLFHP